MAKIRKIFSLWALYARMDLHWFTQDTFTCCLCILSDTISNIASLSGIVLLSVRFGGIGGMSADEMLFMLGFFTLANGLTFMLFGGWNLNNISRRIGRGQVDHMLIQPVPLWMQMLTEGLMPVTGNTGVLCGLALFIAAMVRLEIAVTFGWVLTLLLMLAVHSAVYWGAQCLIGTSAFYRPAACEEISGIPNDFFNTLGKFPLFGLPQWLTCALVTVLPVGLMGWLPSLVLLSKINEPIAYWLPACVAAIIMTLATLAFQKGMKHYVKYGCNRYRDLGHRS